MSSSSAEDAVSNGLECFRNLTYYYPGSQVPALINVNFTLEAGETLAIVGLNGSGEAFLLYGRANPFIILTMGSRANAGKSTLANILLRIADFDRGELLVNDTDIRRIHPTEYHQHVTAVFQGFSRFNASVKENIGVGYVPDIGHPAAIERAAELAGAAHVVCSLPRGLKTTLDTGLDPTASLASECSQSRVRHGLSGGEVCAVSPIDCLLSFFSERGAGGDDGCFAALHSAFLPPSGFSCSPDVGSLLDVSDSHTEIIFFLAFWRSLSSGSVSPSHAPS